MTRPLSRRDFLAGGVIICGAASATTIYLMPGGRSSSRTPLRLFTGVDPTGARELLVNAWNRVNPSATVEMEPAHGSTSDQRRKMIGGVSNNSADILNLDIVHIPYFAAQGLISPIELEDVDSFLEQTRRPSEGTDHPGRFWAAPFNTDVGMLFERLPEGEERGSGLKLAQVVDEPTAGPPQFVGQLDPFSSVSEEIFVVNVLEHALSRKEILIRPDGKLESDSNLWDEALAPLRAAIAAGRIHLSDTEENSRDWFTANSLRYMRNWPVKYWELRDLNDPDAIASRIEVRPLPTGILGGQSLALVNGSRHEAAATDFIHFLTSSESQKVLAAHGLAPTRIEAYNDENLQAFIPHLGSIRGAVERARPRPINKNYSEFSHAVLTHVERLLDGTDERLSSAFIDDIQEVLGQGAFVGEGGQNDKPYGLGR